MSKATSLLPGSTPNMAVAAGSLACVERVRFGCGVAGVAVGACVGVGSGVGVAVGACVGVGVAVGACVGVGSGVGTIEVAVGSGVTMGTGVDVGVAGGGDFGVFVGASVLVGNSVVAGGDPPSHADSIAMASKLSSPIHTMRRMDAVTASPSRKMNANGCLFLCPPLPSSTRLAGLVSPKNLKCQSES